jgi:dCTP deaminase
MLLSHTELLHLIDAGFIKNAVADDVNGASIDIHLGDKVFVEGNTRGAVLDYSRRDALPGKQVLLSTLDGYVIRPGEFILAQSSEVFFLPRDVAAEYKLKSSMARVGLDHANAGWADPGWRGSVLTLELKNITRETPIRIRPGDAIGQMVFFRCTEVPVDASYAVRGRYNNDVTVSGIKP